MLYSESHNELESKVRGDNMKLKNLIITGILMTTMIFAGCGGESETAKVTKEKSPEIQAAWDDILGEESSEPDDEKSDVDDEDDEDAENEEDSENVEESTDDISEDEEEKEGSGKPDTSWYENNGDVITTGIFTVGTDIEEGSYTLTNIDDDGATEVVIFESIDNYLGYYRTDPRFTVGEENDAINANSYYTEYLWPDESCTINLEDGNILKLDNTRTTIVNEGNGKNAFKLGKGKTLKQGIYSSSQIEPGTYIITSSGKADDCNNTYVAFFENNSAYKKFKSADASTIGKFDTAISQNAMFDTYAKSDDPCMINMTEDSILYVEYDDCYIQKVTMNWSK